jgi:hypothetical protein
VRHHDGHEPRRFAGFGIGPFHIDHGCFSAEHIERLRFFAEIALLNFLQTHLAAPAIQKGFTVCEVGIAEMKCADGGEANWFLRVARSECIVEEQSHELFVLAELPDEAASGLLKRCEPPFFEVLPGRGLLACQR